jgi:diguanylate cyclase (GGDEF)-like protein
MLTATYTHWLVVLSVVMAMVVAYTALTLVSRVSQTPGRLGDAWLVGGAAAMGCGIWSMHFIGMLAFRLPIQLRYDIRTTIASLFIAMLTSGFALALASREQLRLPRLVPGAIVMGIGICAMHYLGMAAITVRPGIEYDAPIVALSVAIAIAASFAALWLAFQLRRGTSRAAMCARLGAAAVMGFAISGMHYTGMAAARFANQSYCGGGLALDQGGSAIALAAIAIGLLTVTLVLAVADAHLASKAHEHSATLREAAAALDFQRTHDGLTGLPNRTVFTNRVRELLNDEEGAPEQLAVITLDLDRFRLINDTLGHGTGDLLLAAVATRLVRSVARAELVARGGGDEFLILIVGAGDAELFRSTAHDVIAAFSTPFVVHDVDLHLSPSIGVAVFPTDGTSVEPLLARADEAMYAAKRLGGRSVQFYCKGGHASESRLDLENDLRRALNIGQFELRYQPKVQSATGLITGVEALLRWRHPTRGVVSPNDFIPIAEETGLITPIGRWVLAEACRQAAEWQRAGVPFVRIAVNVSAVQLRDSAFAADVRAELLANRLAPYSLELEVTESSVMTDAESSVRILSELSAAGVLIAVDDFGTGYSSMSYLQRLPIDYLKIDRSFVTEIASRDDARSIAHAIIMLAHALDLKAVAEGVETQEQRAVLASLGCDQLQGFFFYRPMPADVLEAILRSQDGPAPDDLDLTRTRSRLAPLPGGRPRLRIVRPLA